jgi:hypothetical protein
MSRAVLRRPRVVRLDRGLVSKDQKGVSALVRIDSDNNHAVALSPDDTNEEAVDDTPTSSSGRRSTLC